MFKDAKKLKILNKLIHPLVVSKIKMEISRLDCSCKVAIEALYFEKGGLGDIVDKILLIKRDEAKIRRILINERNITSSVANAIVREQKMPNFFDGEVVNNSTFKALEKNVILAVGKLIN
ncbi:MAG TPA: dephospho-CoA kinase [Haliscomenobacter sp.]|nr:dephospho-CoA kinase [Haliscomenobacter sp.]